MTPDEISKVQNPMGIETLEKIVRRQKAALLAVSVAEMMVGELSPTTRKLLADARKIHADTEAVLDEARKAPRLCKRLRTLISDNPRVIRSQFLFPAAVPDADVRALLAHWGVTGDEEKFASAGAECEPLHLYRNARHVLATRAVRVLDEKKFEEDGDKELKRIGLRS